MPGRMYSVQFNNVGVTVQQDFFELVAGAAKPFAIHRIVLSQETEIGDAQEEQLTILIKKGQTTSGSGGTTPTANPLNVNDAATGITAEANNTTKASAGTIITVHAGNWNVRQEWDYCPTPECRPIIAGGERCTVELATTPTDSIDISGTIYVEELA